MDTQQELLILEQGLQSPFWQIMEKHLSDAAMTAAGAALSEQGGIKGNRDWTAGRACGLKEAFNWPKHRVRDLKIKAKSQSEHNRTSSPEA